MTAGQPGRDQGDPRAAGLAAVLAQLRAMLPPQYADRLEDPDFDLRRIGAFDSLAFLELLVWLESAHGVTLPDEELLIENLHSARLIADQLPSAEPDRSSR